jgi:predicted nucleic acid-binding protein
MLQEVLHVCLRRGEALRAQAVLDDLVQVFAGRIEPLQARDVLAAAAGGSERLSSRDRIHLAVMQRLGVDRIISTDQAFDGLSGVTRLNPLTFDSWREEVFGEAD